MAPSGTPPRSARPSALLAANLYRRLKEKYAPTGLAHFGQGKWYPGEPLPRWSLNCFWRKDGQPIWQNPELIADEHQVRYRCHDGAAISGVGGDVPRLSPAFVFGAYEDAFYYLWRERRLPTNVDPFASNLEDAGERERLAKVFDQGLDTAVGYVFPVARAVGGQRWETGPWFLRRERCYLIPGDSPVGFASPLDSMPWVAPADYPYVHSPDPSQAFPPLPQLAEIRRQFVGLDAARKGRWQPPEPLERESASARSPVAQESADWITRTAMCAEPRDGVLYIFMPPTNRLEDYLELVAAVEAAAESLEQPVVIEGYEPPRDPRLNSFRVTPDPGVIEVNIHPSESWEELSDRTEHLYESARQSRLIAEKFMIDGRHTGTGGGNHFVLGGAPTPDSPSCAGPICCAACSRTGTTIPRCRTCSPGSSSAQPRRPRAPTKRATIRSTSWKSRSSRCRRSGTTRRHGSSTACSAICSSTLPATRIGPSSASTSCSRPTAPPADSACWSCARSRCRRMRA